MWWASERSERTAVLLAVFSCQSSQKELETTRCSQTVPVSAMRKTGGARTSEVLGSQPVLLFMIRCSLLTHPFCLFFSSACKEKKTKKKTCRGTSERELALQNQMPEVDSFPFVWRFLIVKVHGNTVSEELRPGCFIWLYLMLLVVYLCGCFFRVLPDGEHTFW